MPRTRLIAVLTLALLAAGCQTVGKPITGIDNFAVVEDGFYRGGQPSYDGITELKQRGVRTVIDLRDDRNPAERKWVEDAGMAYVHIGTNAGRVEPAKIATFLRAVDAAQRPIFIHCHRGRDRTGISVAVYRMVEQNWPLEAALTELYAHGHQWLAFPGIARYLKTFEPQQFRELGTARGADTAG